MCDLKFLNKQSLNCIAKIQTLSVFANGFRLYNVLYGL